MSTTTGSTKGKRRLIDALGDEVQEALQKLSRIEGVSATATSSIEIEEDYEAQRIGEIGAGGGVQGPIYVGLLGNVSAEFSKGWTSSGKGKLRVSLTISATREP